MQWTVKNVTCCKYCKSNWTLIQIQLYFCIACTDTQRNVYLKLAHILSVGMQKYRWWPGLRPGPRWGSSRRSPRPSSRTLWRSSRISVIKLWSPYMSVYILCSTCVSVVLENKKNIVINVILFSMKLIKYESHAHRTEIWRWWGVYSWKWSCGF